MPQVFLESRSGYFLTDPAVDWLAAYEAQMALCVRPAAKASLADATADTAAMAK